MTSETFLLFCWTFLFVRVFVSAEQKNITAESGQDVTLTCRAPNNNILAVKWSRADLEPEHVLLYRDEHFDTDNQHPSFKNRVDLQDRQMKDGDVSVILKDVTTNDEGTYKCRIFMAGTKNEFSSIYLRVVAPPGPGGAPVGLIVGLIVPALLLLLVAAVGFRIYRKRKEQKQDPYQPPAELQPV
ncbi:CD226 antigen-like [Archocentrus centrarchus]|uniref:CD226 antigen-like n=1 Tax=Archocentrus centrarchus TaxID=63155 RepID=UPI0011E9C416|nr:CD226 antigen-like [Archocentrus centrarchus]